MRSARMRTVALLLTILLALVLGACALPAPSVETPPADVVAEAPAGQTAANDPAAAGTPTEAALVEGAGQESAAVSGERLPIKLAENPWSASQLNVAVARILLEEELGYPVEVISIDENAQWPALATGDLSASLEVWPSGHAANVAEYIDGQGTVEYGGELGVIGKIGWYIPTYLLDVDPDLATWEGFLKPETAALFATAETGANGQFLSGDPSFVQYDEQIISNLGLPFQVVYAGSEEAILAALDSAASREDAILFYFWTPHSVHAKYDLTEVALPEYTDECYADVAAIACDYPADHLFKIFWAGLAEAAPDAHTLLRNMTYTTDDQIDMLAAMELEGMSLEEAARAWLDANHDTWHAWLP